MAEVKIDVRAAAAANANATHIQRRSTIIELVKENEKFKVAKEIIEKYGSPEDRAECSPAIARGASAFCAIRASERLPLAETLAVGQNAGATPLQPQQQSALAGHPPSDAAAGNEPQRGAMNKASARLEVRHLN